MKHILIISFSDLARDPRVRRQVHFLKNDFQITAMGYTDPQIPGVAFLPFPRVIRTLTERLKRAMQLKLHQYEPYYWEPEMLAAARRLAGLSFDLIVANEIDSLPLSLRIAKNAKILLDAHEYSPLELEDSFMWRFFFQNYRTHLCREYLPRCHAMVTVSEGIAAAYRNQFGVHPAVITNAIPYQDLRPSPVHEDKVRMIHHGAAIASRKLEKMIALMDKLDDRFSLDLMLVPGSRGYLDKLKRLADGKKGIRFIPPRPMEEIPQTLNGYDIGLYILEPANFNNAHALPNKLFEFIQARLSLAIGPSLEMANIVQSYDCGIVAGGFSPMDIAEKLMPLSPEQITHYKQRSHAAATLLCAEQNHERFLRMVSRLLES